MLLPFSEYYIRIKGPYDNLSEGDQFVDLYLLPLLLTITAAIFYMFTKYISYFIRPAYLAVIVMLFLFFFVAYLIDRLVEYWRFECHNARYLDEICLSLEEEKEK